MAYNLACWCIQMAYTQHSWMLMDIVVGLSVRPSVRLFVYSIFRWLCICWQITWNKWHKIWHDVVIIGRWLLPSLVDTGDICCHYWQLILVVNWTFRNKLQWNSNGNTQHFIHKNAFENVLCGNGGHFVQGEMSLLNQWWPRYGMLWGHYSCCPFEMEIGSWRNKSVSASCTSFCHCSWRHISLGNQITVILVLLITHQLHHLLHRKITPIQVEWGCLVPAAPCNGENAPRNEKVTLVATWCLPNIIR